MTQKNKSTPPPASDAKSSFMVVTGQNKKSLMADYGRVVNHFSGIGGETDSVATASSSVIRDISVRAPFSRHDYESFRPEEALPKHTKDVIKACRQVYKQKGIVRQIIDMMTDFAIAGLDVAHVDAKNEIFLRVWMDKVKLRAAAEEFIRHDLIDCNVVAKRITGQLPKPTEAQWRNAKADADVKVLTDKSSQEAREIPIKYEFLNIVNLEWKGGELARWSGERPLTISLDTKFIATVKSPKTTQEKAWVKKIPLDIREQILEGKTKSIELDMEKIYVSHNKKDSWDDWATPFLYSVLEDLYFKDKLRQAEISALDGIINVIRLWKLGDHVAGFLPDEGAVDKLINIIESNTGGGAFDIVWNSLIDMKEYYPPIGEILGPEKYEQVNQDILIGLGIPEVLLGGKGANFSNAFIQLKTVIERLKTVRSHLTEWLDKELRFLCDGLDIKVSPIVLFDNNNLEDENVANQFLLQLFDRGIVSVSTMHKTSDLNTAVEVDRIKDQKAVFNDTGGIPIKNPLDKTGPSGPEGTSSGPKGGRPVASPDVQRRKTKIVKPRGTKANLMLKGLEVADYIHKTVQALYMKENNVDNARKLTNEQMDDVDRLKLHVLACIHPVDELSPERIVEIMDQSPNLNIVEEAVSATKEYLANNGQLTLLQQTQIHAVVWANHHIEKENSDDLDNDD